MTVVHTEPCAWNPNASLCSLSLEGVAQILSEGGGGDGLCGYFSALANAGCASLQGQAACLQNENCDFADNGESQFCFLFQEKICLVCVVGATYFTDVALDEDPNLVSSIEGVLGSCLAFPSADACPV